MLQRGRAGFSAADGLERAHFRPTEWARAPGGGGALESTWPRPMRASRELYGCDLALAETLFPAARLRGL
jgi:hypothetical protein